jgi:hypothetical protein
MSVQRGTAAARTGAAVAAVAGTGAAVWSIDRHLRHHATSTQPESLSRSRCCTLFTAPERVPYDDGRAPRTIVSASRWMGEPDARRECHKTEQNTNTTGGVCNRCR